METVTNDYRQRATVDGEVAPGLSSKSAAAKKSKAELESEAHHNWATAYLASSDYSAALEELDRAIELNSGNLPAYFDRAVAYSGLKDFQKVVADCDKMISINPALRRPIRFTRLPCGC
jgi:tetratricopeptide (TPR) repeat protein